jgi:adenosylmethionine---8-amino-7-oxononanoate aminotransferase
MVTPLQQRDRAVVWHPCGQMRDYESFPPLEIIAAQGGWLTLKNNQRIFDAISSWWCKSFGHGHPHLRAALIRQSERFEHVITANTTNDDLVSYCERLLALANGLPPSAWGPGVIPPPANGHFGKVFFADNGSTAVEVALKMALQAQLQRGNTQRTQFAAFTNGYHGETVGALSVGDCGIYKDTFSPLLFPCTMLGPLPYRSGPDDPQWFSCADAWPAIEQQLNSKKDRLAAIIYEPILQGAGGMLLYSPELLRKIHAWAKPNNVFLIADEIASGMGRCGAPLAHHLAGLDVLPDFAVLSKGLTGGFIPFATVLTTNAVYDNFLSDWAEGRAFLHSNTYAGNALGIALGHAALDIIAQENLLDHVARTGAFLRQQLLQIARTQPQIKNVRSLGMMAGVDIRHNDGSPFAREKRIGWHIFRAATQRGALLRPLGDTMYIFPPLNSTNDEIAHVVEVLAQSIRDVVG